MASSGDTMWSFLQGLTDHALGGSPSLTGVVTGDFVFVHKEKVREMLSAGLWNVNARVKRDRFADHEVTRTLLWFAVFFGEKDVVKWLLAERDATRRASEHTLMEAIQTQTEGIVDMFIRALVDTEIAALKLEKSAQMDARETQRLGRELEQMQSRQREIEAKMGAVEGNKRMAVEKARISLESSQEASLRLDARIGDLQFSLKTIETEDLVRLTSEERECIKKLSDAQRDVGFRQNQLRDFNSSNAATPTKVRQAASSLAEAEKSYALATDQLSKLQSKHNAILNEYAEKTTRLRDLEQEKRALDERIEHLRADLRKAEPVGAPRPSVNSVGSRSEALTCPICLDLPFNRVFRCGHCACNRCVDKLFAGTPPGRPVPCHGCRKPVLKSEINPFFGPAE